MNRNWNEHKLGHQWTEQKWALCTIEITWGSTELLKWAEFCKAFRWLHGNLDARVASSIWKRKFCWSEANFGASGRLNDFLIVRTEHWVIACRKIGFQLVILLALFNCASSLLAASIDRFLTKAEYEFLRTRSPSHDLKVFLRLRLVCVCSERVYWYTGECEHEQRWNVTADIFCKTWNFSALNNSVLRDLPFP